MRPLATALVYAALLTAFDGHSFAQAESVSDVRVYFSPKGGCAQAVVAEVAKAKREILVQAYSFTSRPIAEALVAARKRGVTVTVVADRSDVRGLRTMLPLLKAGGVPVFIDSRHAIAHNKVMLLDGETVLSGSFNFTLAAEEHNAENLLVIRSGELAKTFQANWQKHRDHSARY